MSDVTAVTKDVVDLCSRSMDDNKQVYMSLPRPGVSLLLPVAIKFIVLCNVNVYCGHMNCDTMLLHTWCHNLHFQH